jgi:hypothetical protein
MADNTAPQDADGYYDEDNTNSEELDLSFLDENEEEKKDQK